MPAELTLPFDVNGLLQALSEDAPSGPDLGYDARFGALEQASAGKPERQYGDKIYAAEPPLWPEVYEQALALAADSRDLRVAVLLLRSATRVHGFAGATAGLMLLDGLLAKLWPSVHPQLDPSEGDDPTMRVNALTSLVALDAFPADLRAAALTPARGAMRLRDLELGLGADEAQPDETQPSADGVMSGLRELLGQHPALAAQSTAALAAVRSIAATLNDKAGALNAADPVLVGRLLTVLAGAVGRLQPEVADSAGDASLVAGMAGGMPGASARAPGEIASRADAAAALERICQWFERHEPAHPAPLLLRRAQRLLDKSFIEIMRDIAPDGVGQVENLAGQQG